MPRVSIQGEMESDESHLVKVDPGGTFEQFLEQAEGRLGFRPAGVYLKGTRVLAVEDLEEDDQLTCCRVPRGAATPGPAAAPAAAAAASPAAAPAPVPGVLNVKVSSQDDDINLRLKLSTRLVKLYKAVADSKGLPGPKLDGASNESLSFRLMFDGQRLNMTLTPADYEMEDNDVIDYFVEATGGAGKLQRGHI
jgi:hypothetical protein|tara:strand:+ start:51 stop:632 length:582 start_codon:yes stop_codon:yes gene_type:complete